MAGEEPIGRDGRRGYRLSGELCVGRLLPADLFRAIENTGTSNTVVAPTGFEPVFGRGRVFASFSNEFGNGSRPESRPD